MQNKSHQQIAILDFGSQYTHLISRRFRDFSVLARIYPPDVKIDILRRENLIGLILSGGPKSVYNKIAIKYNLKIFDLKIPILGLCYGHQLIGQYFGGKVKPGKVREYGFAKLKIKNYNSTLFNKLPYNLQVWMSHGDSVVKVPTGFDILASTNDCAIAAMGDLNRHIYGLQFHPEVHHTKDKNKILHNFAIKICKARQDWKINNVMAGIVADIKAEVTGKKVFMLVSGGVDSSVAFALLKKNLGKKNVIGLHIDSGLMRKNESAQVVQNLAKAGFDDLNVANAEAKFLTRLQDVSDPEQKRKIIGETYLDAAEQWFKKNVKTIHASLLGQGTIYPDTIETGGTKHADTIKTHHNRIDRIKKMIKQGKVIEPLKNFYKDEVRAIGRKLNLPNHLLNRHPFPGPGLGIRVLCNKNKINDLKLPKLKFKKTALNCQILPIKSVGVQGDSRTYAYPLAIWGINNWNKLEKISTNLTNKYRKINRVIKVCWIRGEAPNFQCKQNTYLTKERLDLLREINHIVEQEIRKAKIYDKIWQFPVVLVPLTLSGGESIILRPVESCDAMTANFYKMSASVLTKITHQIAKFTEIDAVFYDVTNKPPATIEWE